MTTFSAHDVAMEIRKRIPGVPTKKLHKLLYYCQGFHVAVFGHGLFGEQIEAWDRGPVVADLWRAEKYGTAPQTRSALGKGELNTVGYVVSRYGSMTGADLEALTHHEPPWIIANERRKLTGQQQIDLDEMKAFFRSSNPFDDFDDQLDDAADDYEPPEDLVRSWLADAPTRLRDELHIDDLETLGKFINS